MNLDPRTYPIYQGDYERDIRNAMDAISHVANMLERYQQRIDAYGPDYATEALKVRAAKNRFREGLQIIEAGQLSFDAAEVLATARELSKGETQ